MGEMLAANMAFHRFSPMGSHESIGGDLRP